MLKLHHAPNSRSVRIVWLLEELGLPYALERYTLAGADMRTPEFRALNPMGRVPILEDGDVMLNESGAITEYVLSRHAPGQLRPDAQDAEYPAYLQWLHFSEGMLMPPVNSYMVETFFLPPERQSEEHAKRAKKLMGRMLGAVEAGLDGRDWLAGAFSGADIMTGSAVVSVLNIGVPADELPRVQAYAERIKARPAFQAAQKA
jgi:glutathione S-transferase